MNQTGTNNIRSEQKENPMYVKETVLFQFQTMGKKEMPQLKLMGIWLRTFFKILIEDLKMKNFVFE